MLPCASIYATQHPGIDTALRAKALVVLLHGAASPKDWTRTLRGRLTGLRFGSSRALPQTSYFVDPRSLVVLLASLRSAHAAELIILVDTKTCRSSRVHALPPVVRIHEAFATTLLTATSVEGDIEVFRGSGSHRKAACTHKGSHPSDGAAGVLRVFPAKSIDHLSSTQIPHLMKRRCPDDRYPRKQLRVITRVGGGFGSS